MSVRVLVADKLDPTAFDGLDGIEAELRPELGAADIPGVIAGFDVLIVRSTKVTRAAIEAADRLALIVRAGSGTNNIDVEAASERAVYVANCPGKNAVAVAELAMALILAADRAVPDNVADLRAGRWDKAKYSKARGLKGQRLGLVGFGNIARAVAARAQAFGMEVCAYSRSLTQGAAAELGVQRAGSLAELFSGSDIVSLHVPASAETEGMVSAELVASMPGGALLVNTSRAAVWDEAAVLEAAKEGRIRVATDVISGEPEHKSGAVEHPFAGVSGVYCTHHIGASTAQAQAEIAAAAVEAVRVFASSGAVPNAVNLCPEDSDPSTLVVRHLDEVGVLANVLSALSAAGINVGEMNNTIFVGRRAACAKLAVAPRPDEAALQKVRGLARVIAADLL